MDNNTAKIAWKDVRLRVPLCVRHMTNRNGGIRRASRGSVGFVSSRKLVRCKYILWVFGVGEVLAKRSSFRLLHRSRK
jgi:hypothetical protein